MITTIKMDINELMAKIDSLNGEDRTLEKEMVKQLALECSEYISSVSNMENAINIARFRLDIADYQDLITNLDKSRVSKHNVVISGVKVLNKLSYVHGLAPIFVGDVNSRIQVAEFAKQYVDELFNERRI